MGVTPVISLSWPTGVWATQVMHSPDAQNWTPPHPSAARVSSTGWPTLRWAMTSSLGHANSVLRPFVDHRIPEAHAMQARLAEPSPAQFPPDHRIEIAMRDQRGLALLAGALHQDVGSVRGALLGASIILDLRMIARVPKNARDDCPFRDLHPKQRNARAGERRLDEQGIGDQLRMWRQQLGALRRAQLRAGMNRIQLADEILQLFRRRARRI